MSEMTGEAREDQFLGALLGMAIGDALGKPVTGMTAEEISGRHGTVDDYLPAESTEGEPLQGEITGITETVLCMVESITTNNGMVDPENINARLTFLVQGPSRSWMSPAMIEGIERAGESGGVVGDEQASEPELAVAVRGVTVGLLHAVGAFDATAMARDARLAARLSHGGRRPAATVNAVATLTNLAARSRSIPGPASVEGQGDIEHAIRAIVGKVRNAPAFEDGVSAAIGAGGATNETGALAGALLGARDGASGLPQHLIDGLDARIYLTLAAPWFYRAAQRRAGTVIDLRVIP